MRLGIDVGGTHTDAVLFHEGTCISSAKVLTRHNHLISSIRSALAHILRDARPEQISRLNLSTTLCTNAIVENKMEPVGMLVSSGPGLGREHCTIGLDFHFLSGSIDHRGREIVPLQDDEVRRAVKDCLAKGIRVFGAVSKFSTRNPGHELLLREALGKEADFVTMGHALSGNLNFPRRVFTSYYNSAVWRIYNGFLDAVLQTLKEFGISCTVNAVKADGGTCPLPISRSRLVQSIFSGPSASIMGIMALSPVKDDAIVLDIGGTTTDIAVFASGIPLLEPEGTILESRPTLVRALKARSIGIGGDSALTKSNGILQIGPKRYGPPVAAGGSVPTLTDAMNVLGIAQFQDVQASRKTLLDLSGSMEKAHALAAEALKLATKQIFQATMDFLREINEQPVYTLLELLERDQIAPTRVVVMGGPAQALVEPLQDLFRLPVELPPLYDRANAVGAALTRTTQVVELYADTSRGRVFVPTTGLVRSITSDYSLSEAVAEARAVLGSMLEDLGVRIDPSEIQVTQSSSFNMVDGFAAVGKNIRVKCQTVPGVVRTLVS
ncbi:MAG: hydantoinase/oxoprolinase family protein [Desulfovibrionales bacterium]